MGVEIVSHRLRTGLFCYYTGLPKRISKQGDSNKSTRMDTPAWCVMTLLILTVYCYHAATFFCQANNDCYTWDSKAVTCYSYFSSHTELSRSNGVHCFVDTNKLIRDGDIQTNPGPVKNPCGHCRRPVAKNHRALRCTGCFLDIHIKCGNISPAYHQQCVQQNLQWLCSNCTTPSFNFSDSFFSQLDCPDTSSLNDSSASDLENESSDESDFYGINHLKNMRLTHRHNFMSSYLNINSLRYKFDGIKDLVTRCSLDFTCIAETKLDSSYFDGLFSIENYRTFRKDNTSHSGGLLAFVRSEIPCQRKTYLECKHLESLCIEVTLANTKWLLACLYGHPKMNKSQFENEMTVLLDKILLDYDRYILMGDLNHDMTPGTEQHSLTDLCTLFDLKNTIGHPTCFKTPRGTVLDVVLVPDRRHLQMSGVVDTGLSDYHRLIYAITKTHAPKPTRRQITYRSFKTLDQEAYLQDLSNAPFHVANIFDEVDDLFYFMNTLFTDITNEHMPIKTKTIKTNAPPHMNKRLRKACMDKARYRHRFHKFPNKENWERYRVQRNLTNKIKRQSIRTYFHERCSDPADTQTFWNTLRPFYTSKGSRAVQNIQLLEEDQLITSPVNVADIFNEYYTNITSTIGSHVEASTLQCDDADFISFSNEKHKDHPSVKKISERHTASDFSFTQIPPAETEKILNKMDTKKATGYDSVSSKVLKIAAPVISIPLTAVINKCVTTAKFPSDCKKAEVGPIHKKESLLNKKNYRPVSVLTGVSKVIEKCINSQLSSFCEKVLSPHISAYRKGYSCQYSLMKLTEDMRKTLDNGEVATLALTDLSKTFDCLPHDLMVAKLTAYGMHPSAVQLLTSYLRNRQQRVKVGSDRSEWLTILKGVPQGSIIGPSLFNIFLNDYVHFIKSSIVNYADDNTICAVGKTLQDSLQRCSEDVHSSLLWFAQNQMQANPLKFQFLHTCVSDDSPLQINNVTLNSEDTVKLLGVNVDKRLKFTAQVDTVIRKCANQLNALKRQSKLLNTRTKLLIYHAFIEANFNFCPLIWMNRNKTDMSRIEKVNKRALRLVYGGKKSYEELLIKANTCSLQVRWKRQLVTEVYKAVNGLSPSYVSDLFQEKRTVYELRSKSLQQEKFKTITHGFHSLRHEGTRLWEALPNNCQNAKDLQTFKKLLKKTILT